MAVKGEVLRISGYAREYFSLHSADLLDMADAMSVQAREGRIWGSNVSTYSLCEIVKVGARFTTWVEQVLPHADAKEYIFRRHPPKLTRGFRF